MKKSNLNLTIVLALALMLSIWGCKKEATKTTETPVNTEQQLNTWVDDVSDSYSKTEVAGGSETEEFDVKNDGLPEDYILIEMDMDDAGFKRVELRPLIKCLKGLELSDSQVLGVRKGLRAYEECKAADIKKHREEYQALKTRIENIRKEWVGKLRGEKITKAEFETKMQNLRKEFNSGLTIIEKKYAARLKECHTKFMRAIKSRLTERQWLAFVKCNRA